MPPPEYEALSADGDESEAPAKYPPQPRPATYYGEGDFEPPSSDDEEDAFLEKKPGHVPLDSELGGELLTEDGELVIGGKACQLSFPASREG